MVNEEKAENTIFLKECQKKEIGEIIERVEKSESEKIRVKIQTKHWFGYGEPDLLTKTSKIEIEKSTMLDVLNGIIEKYKEQENKVIDMLIDNEIEKRELGKILRSDKNE